MDQIVKPAQIQKRCLAWRAEGLRIALAPTMGFFHAGHESLMREGRRLADKLVVSLFVNPTQFGPGEDLNNYPRDPEKDALTAEACGADVLFMPEPEDMYAADHAAWVEVPDLAGTLCGLSRPTHFRGVATVVAKLFMLVQPHIALFGRKDWQQLVIIRRLARDLSIPVEILGLPVVREEDGLAMSSRNAYLSPEERRQAPHLYKGLLLARELARNGAREVSALETAVRRYWSERFPLGRVDYLSFVHPETLRAADRLDDSVLAAAAVFTRRARLIDNLLLEICPTH
ncbi:MAG: pantoate--beta-alanine ligase [Deltaproteobacteria bacterium]|jgi:pantoate--beta-alanine ligase|nr:pantoate--beta-alanine ligase [Deltaproteobacteria bacterium]